MLKINIRNHLPETKASQQQSRRSTGDFSELNVLRPTLHSLTLRGLMEIFPDGSGYLGYLAALTPCKQEKLNGSFMSLCVFDV